MLGQVPIRRAVRREGKTVWLECGHRHERRVDKPIRTLRCEKCATKWGTGRRGLAWEGWVSDRLGSTHDVQRMPSNHPFDLTVNGWRVDVKSAMYTEYPLRSKPGCFVRGYQFAGLKSGVDCDRFLLLCHRDGDVEAFFVVPSDDVPRLRLTITPKCLAGGGRYGSYLHALHLLARDS